MKKIAPYGIIFLVLYNLVPLLYKIEGLWRLSIVFLFVLFPLASLLLSLYYGFKNRFDLLFLIIQIIAFIPSIFIYYNRSVAIYIVIYTVVSALGLAIGTIISKKKNT